MNWSTFPAMSSSFSSLIFIFDLYFWKVYLGFLFILVTLSFPKNILKLLAHEVYVGRVIFFFIWNGGIKSVVWELCYTFLFASDTDSLEWDLKVLSFWYIFQCVQNWLFSSLRENIFSQISVKDQMQFFSAMIVKFCN